MAKQVSRALIERGWRRRRWRERAGLLGGLLAGFFLTTYTFWGGRTIFMERPLSINHRGLERRCGNCHHAFSGVQDTRCAFPCHAGSAPTSAAVIPYKEGIHYVKGRFGNANCLECHPPECHSVPAGKKADTPVPPKKSDVACKPKEVENLVLPNPLTLNTCKSCHPGGCTRPVRCLDCHPEHLDGMPMPVNRADEVFAGRFAFPKNVLNKMESDRYTEHVKEQVALPVAYLRRRGKMEAWAVEKFMPRMPAANCLGCHPDVLTRTPPTVEEIEKSIVPRSIFNDMPRRHRRPCYSCHREVYPTKRDPQEKLFTMEACTEKCHYADDCTSCHKFHQRAAEPGEHVHHPR